MPNTSSIKYLIDTNILVYSLDKKSPFYERASRILIECIKGERLGVIAQQNIVECTNVLFKESKKQRTEILLDLYTIATNFNLEVINPFETTLFTFLKLLEGLKKRRRELFDVFLAATMFDNGIATIITINEKDFEDIKGIFVYNPWKE